MNFITSSDNKIVKRTASLKQKKYRDSYGEFIVEGKKNVLDSCATRQPKRVFLVDESDASGFECQEIYVVSSEIMQKLADTVTPQSVIAVYDQIKPAKISADNVIFLDRIRDPGNLGTIVRCCAATGYQMVMHDCVDIFNPKVVRSCMSGISKIDFAYSEQYSIENLKLLGYKILCADASGKNIFDYKRSDEKICLVIGNEAEGISDKIINSCDEIISIPMQNMESLNAAVSAAILMFNLKFNGGN